MRRPVIVTLPPQKSLADCTRQGLVLHVFPLTPGQIALPRGVALFLCYLAQPSADGSGVSPGERCPNLLDSLSMCAPPLTPFTRPSSLVAGDEGF